MNQGEWSAARRHVGNGPVRIEGEIDAARRVAKRQTESASAALGGGARAALGVVLAAVACAPAQAQSDSRDAASSENLERATVTGYRFLDEDTSGITNLPLPVEKVPQSISLLNNDFVKAADLKNMGEVAQYTPGAIWASYSPSYGNQIWLRGFSAGFAIDGLTVGDQITDPDPAILERYEVVKGPASVVYGAQSPGGVVNLVSKSASPDTPSYIEALAGSWGRWRVEGQAAGALNESGSIRGIGVVAHEEGGSFVDFVQLNKSVLYGGLDVDITKSLTGYFRASFQRTEDTPYNGIPTYADGSLVPVSYAYFLGGSAFRAAAQATRVDTGLKWKPTDAWAFSLQGIYQYTTHGGRNAYPYSTIASDGTFPFGGENFNDWHVYDATLALSAARTLDDVGLSDSSVSANLRYQHYRYDIFETFLSGGSADIFSGDTAVSGLFNAQTIGAGFYQQDQQMNYLTASSQAVVKVAKPLTLVGGVTLSRPVIDLQVDDGAWQNFDPGNQLKYRLAAVVEAAKGLDLYASYSESYQPNLRVDVNFNSLPPLSGRQYEAGAKVLLNRRLLLTAAVFQIRESNVPVYVETVGGEALYKVSGVQHRGLELEANGQVAERWQVRAGLAFLDPKVTQDPTNSVNDGETRPWLPKVTANLYANYDFGNGLSMSGGTRHEGSIKTYDNASPSPTLPIRAYTVADAGVSYALDKWHVQLNLKNIFNEKYYLSTPIFQSLAAGLYPGEPRSVGISVRRSL